jgi:dephospho-CoA kinase
VFADPQELAVLNGLLHPLIVQRVLQDCEQARRDGAALVVVDAALLFELDLDRDCDATVLVDCTQEQQVERLVRDRGLDATQARQRLAAQWTPEERRARASLVLDNRGTLADLDAETLRVWTCLQDLVQARQSAASST